MIGKLDRKATIQVKTTVTDSWGQALDMWSDLGTVWCQVKPQVNKRAILLEKAGQEQFKEVASFIIRYRSDVPDTARLQYEGKTWIIVQRGEVGETRRRYLELVCLAVNSDLQDGN